MLIELFVDDKDYNSEDGYTLFSYDSEEIAHAVKLALNNGFEDIRISKASNEYKLDYDMRNAHFKD